MSLQKCPKCKGKGAITKTYVFDCKTYKKTEECFHCFGSGYLDEKEDD